MVGAVIPESILLWITEEIKQGEFTSVSEWIRVACREYYEKRKRDRLGDLENFDFSVSFLKEEVNRANLLGIKYVVLHPGASVSYKREDSIESIIKGLNNDYTIKQGGTKHDHQQHRNTPPELRQP